MSDQSHREKLEEMLAEDPSDAELHYMVAMAYASEDDDAGAVRHFQQIIDNTPDYMPAYHQNARALVRLARIEEAKAILNRGIPLAREQGNDHAAGEMGELLESL